MTAKWPISIDIKFKYSFTQRIGLLRPFISIIITTYAAIIIFRLEALDGETVANSCRRTLTTLVQNAMENVENKILEVLDMVGEKVILKFFDRNWLPNRSC